MGRRKKCVFDVGLFKQGCSALTEKICETKECPFFKHSKEYEMDISGYVKRKGK